MENEIKKNDHVHVYLYKHNSFKLYLRCYTLREIYNAIKVMLREFTGDLEIYYVTLILNQESNISLSFKHKNLNEDEFVAFKILVQIKSPKSYVQLKHNETAEYGIAIMDSDDSDCGMD